MNHAAIGVNAIVSEVSEKVFVLAHAWLEVRAAEARKLPEDVASHMEICDRVSELPPFVQPADIEDMAFEPADAADHVTVLRVVSPAAAFDAPADPGSPMCSLTANVVGAVNAVPASMSSHLLARLTADRPTVTVYSPLA